MRSRWVAPIAAAVMALAGCGRQHGAGEGAPAPVVEVTLARAAAADVPLAIEAPATVFPREQANISARITAPIRRLLAHKGDSVTAGQTLVELEDRDLKAQAAEAQAAVSTARATLEKTIAGTLPTDVERARGQVEISKAVLAQFERLYRRRKALFEEGAIPKRDFEQTEADLATAKANAEVAARTYNLLLNQSRGRDEQIARANLEQAEARFQAATAQLQFTHIQAPFAGTITEQMQYPGDMAQPAAATFTLADLSLVTARAQVPEAALGRVKTGQGCRFVPIDGAGAALAGKVTVVNRAVDPQRRTVEVWCETAHPAAWVRTGMFGTASIITGEIRGAVLAPQAAVLREEGTNSATVFVVDDHRIAHRREVTLGEAVGNQARIESGLRAGETVVVEGAYGLPDNARVTTGTGKEKQ